MKLIFAHTNGVGELEQHALALWQCLRASWEPMEYAQNAVYSRLPILASYLEHKITMRQNACHVVNLHVSQHDAASHGHSGDSKTFCDAVDYLD